MRETASVRRQAPRNLASILDSARELGIRDAQVRELSRIAEQELHALVLSCTRARQQVLATIAVNKPTIH